jgi:acyl-CoA synthetase (AMP-forming)/AMP-acid ligase II
VHPHVEVKIVDPENGRTLSRGEPGELCTRGYSVMLGYWDDEEKTRASVDASGWMHTGDLAVIDARAPRFQQATVSILADAGRSCLTAGLFMLRRATGRSSIFTPRLRSPRRDTGPGHVPWREQYRLVRGDGRGLHAS